MHLSRFALLIPAAALWAGAPHADAGLARARNALSGLPMRFEANRGQWLPEVRFAARAEHYSVAFTEAGPRLSFGGSRSLEISLDGANRAARIEGLEPAGARTNYFVGQRSQWRMGVPGYSRVRYR